MNTGLALNWKLLKRGLLVWVLIWIAIMSTAYATSDGSPICDGPLVFSVDESFPPACDDPVDGLVVAAPIVFAAGLVLLGGILLFAPSTSSKNP